MEPVAIKSYLEFSKTNHDGFHISESGLHIKKGLSFLGASPDGLIQCECHGKGVLEVKCPYKYRNGLNGCFADANFPLTSTGEFKTNHQYYYQIQHQMLVTDRNYCHFYI